MFYIRIISFLGFIANGLYWLRYSLHENFILHCVIHLLFATIYFFTGVPWHQRRLSSGVEYNQWATHLFAGFITLSVIITVVYLYIGYIFTEPFGILEKMQFHTPVVIGIVLFVAAADPKKYYPG